MSVPLKLLTEVSQIQQQWNIPTWFHKDLYKYKKDWASHWKRSRTLTLKWLRGRRSLELNLSFDIVLKKENRNWCVVFQRFNTHEHIQNFDLVTCFYWRSATLSQMSLKFAFGKGFFFLSIFVVLCNHAEKNGRQFETIHFFHFFAHNYNLTYSINDSIFIYWKSGFLARGP